MMLTKTVTAIAALRSCASGRCPVLCVGWRVDNLAVFVDVVIVLYQLRFIGTCVW
jgi:hypothetical protein